MTSGRSPENTNRMVWQALGLWALFILMAVIINGTIPFLLGTDMRSWAFSRTQNTLSGLVVYGLIFLVAPLILVKGWQTVRQPGFLIPLLLAIVASALFNVYRGIAAGSVLILAYLHWRYDLSTLGIRSYGWKGDVAAILLMAGLSLLPILLRQPLEVHEPRQAAISALDRMFANPASTVENLFYFGFLAERLSYKTGRWLTPFLIGGMYTFHEMTNPEYWYESVNFALVFVTVVVAAFFYLWRRSVVVIWLGDGLSRFVRALLG